MNSIKKLDCLVYGNIVEFIGWLEEIWEGSIDDNILFWCCLRFFCYLDILEMF